MDLQTLILNLQHFWADHGCVIQQPLDLEVGAGTMHPETFLRVLGPEPYRVAYVQPSRRPADARYGENPFRLGRHLQFQVILKPSPGEVQNLYLQSLEALGIDPAVHDIRFEEDNWESPTLGAWGVGWQVLLDGMEVTQFTYFQQAGGIELAPISAELTYGLERIAMFLGRKDSIYDIEWGGGLPYGQIRLEDERESSIYGFEVADVEMLRRHLEDWESEARRCLDNDPPLVIPALEATLKTSHMFNLLDARGAVSVTERVGLIGRVRKNAIRTAKAYVARREELGHPLGNALEGVGVMAAFLLELRTEEIPANALPAARRQLGDGVAKSLMEAGFSDADVKVFSTSLRLMLTIDGLPERQPDRSERLTGPPTRIAFGEDGKPTKAAEGFAEKAGIALDAIETESTDKGDYLAATVVREGRATTEILAEVVATVLTAMRFPKMMRWGLGEHYFVRPVHGLVALFGSEVVPIEIFGIEAGRETVGHRVHGPETFEVGSAADYVGALADRGVLIDPAQRRRILDERAADLSAEAGCSVHPDNALVAEHVELVEYPGLLRGAIDPEYLELPPEVVITTLRYHQKCLILEHKDGSLAPQFLTVIDRRDDPEGLVRQGNEWVIGARLADARFFFDEDRKRAMEDWSKGLDRLEFHRVLGSIAAKADRVGALAAVLNDRLDLNLDHEALRRAAHLVKTDLLTNMVVEFPELQGVMGGHYLRLEGADEGLWTAARDHYRPSGFDGEIPVSEIGRILGVADRLDTIVGLFGVGEIPSGSKDPLGLRRAAQAVVKIIVEAGLEIDLEAAIESATEGLGEAVETPADEIASAVREFVAHRVRRYLTDQVGVGADAADAVMAAGWGDLPELRARAGALDAVRTSPRMRALGLAFKRVKNITEDAVDTRVDPGLFETDEERELHAAAEVFATRLSECVGARRFDDAFASMSELAEVLDRFFIEVLVMADDQKLRDNRVALLTQLRRDFLTLADLSRLQVDGGKE